MKGVCKRQILILKCFFIAVDYFYIGVMYSCVKGHSSLQILLTCKTFPDKIDCVKFVTTSKSNRGKNFYLLLIGYSVLIYTHKVFHWQNILLRVFVESWGDKVF